MYWVVLSLVTGIVINHYKIRTDQPVLWDVEILRRRSIVQTKARGKEEELFDTLAAKARLRWP